MTCSWIAQTPHSAIVRTVAYWILLSMAIAIPTSGQLATASDDRADAERIDTLVRRLGDAEFNVREKAGERLLEIGADAIPALEQAADNPDREIRFRAQRLIALIRKYDFQRRLRSFATETPADDDLQLPGWRRVRDVLGDTTSSRALYVEMVRAETPLFEALETTPAQATRAIEMRIIQLRQDHSLGTEPLPFAPIAAVVFMGTQKDIDFNDESIEILLALCSNQPGFHKAITESVYRDHLRVMLGSVIQQANVWASLQAIPFAMQYDIKEGLVPATQILSMPLDETHVELRRWAVLAVAKFGDRNHTEILEKCLMDETPVVSPAVAIHRGYETQLRDIALAALWKLHGEEPQRHGFGEHLQTDPQFVFQTVTVGFENDTQRQAAIADWREFRGDQKASEPQ